MTLWEPGDPAVEGGTPRAGDVAGDDAATEPDSPEVTWTVAELGTAISGALGDAFADELWLRGEIRSLRSPNRSGHRYFDLVEPGAEPGAQPTAKLSITLFRSARERVNATLNQASGTTRIADGVEVRIRGRVDWWVAGGQLRLVMTGIDPVFTLGRLDEQRRLLLATLAEEGLLRRNAEHAVPVLPLRVGLVTSAGSAAHADFVHELEASGYAFDVRLADARVQGLDAPASVVAAIGRVVEQDVDVIAVVRGGGATTDLAAFDHESIARAIALAPVPVFTGIGHEIDRNVAGEVAHTDFKTPTATAAALVAQVAEAEAALDAAQLAIVSLAQRRLRESADRLEVRAQRTARSAQVASLRAQAGLDVVAARLGRAVPRRLVVAGEALDRRAHAAAQSAPRRLSRAAERLDDAEARVRAYDPAHVLARGWSLTRTEDGRLVTDLDHLPVGARLHTTVAAGTITSTVDSTTTHTDTTRADPQPTPSTTPERTP